MTFRYREYICSDNEVINDRQKINFFRFPILFVYDPAKGGVPPILRSISHYFKDYFNFGLVDKKNVPDFQAAFSSYPKPRAEQLPQPVALIGEEPSDEGTFSFILRFI